MEEAMKRMLLTAGAVGVLLGLGLGCKGKASTAVPLRPAEFYAARNAAAAPAAAEQAEKPAAPAQTPDLRAAVVPAMVESRTKRATVRSKGAYMIVGTVIAEANAQPIYADKVLAKVDIELSKKADLPASQFRTVATALIRQEVNAQVEEEIMYAAAQRKTTDEDLDLAANLTAVWRQKEITKAGGSVAVARRLSLNPPDGAGIDFDEKIQEQYRRYLVQIYLQRHIWRKVQVSADDMRLFYDRNVAELFSEKAQARFRMIKIAFKAGDVEEKAKALAKAQEYRKRAETEEFGKLAQEANSDRILARNGGYMERVDETGADGQTRKVGAFLERGTLRHEEFERAVFALEPGQMTEIMDGRDGFYFAKLEEKKGGQVRAFEDPQVQELIRSEMDKRQKRDLQQKELLKLRQASVSRVDESKIETTVDMAMQRYGK